MKLQNKIKPGRAVVTSHREYIYKKMHKNHSTASLTSENISLSPPNDIPEKNSQSDHHQTTNQQAKNWKLIYTPPLAQAMRELKIRHPAEATIFVNQLAFWMQTSCGQTTKDGRKWIYNSYENWTKTQFTSLSVSQFGKMIRDLETLKIIEKGNYASLRSYLISKIPGTWHPDQTQSWITLNLERLIELTGYNPFDETWKPLSSAEVLNETTGDSNQNKAEFQSQLPTIYIENSISTQKEKFEKKKVEDINQGNQEFDQWLDFDPWSDELPLDTHYVENLKGKPLIDHIDTSEGECSAAPPPDFENLINESKCDSVPGVGFKKKSNPSPDVKDQAQQVWEIAPKRPFPVFLHWWADKKYKPQGGKWESAAISNAYSEFYKDCDRTTVAIFPEFLEYMQQVAQNCNQLLASGIKAILPSCFVAMPEANLENVRQVMVNIQELVDKGATVALPTNSVTPSCTQSMSFNAAANAGIIQPLQEFIAIAPTPEPEVSPDEELLRILQIKQTSWRNAPALRDGIKRWVERTLGVVMGENGPELQLE